MISEQDLHRKLKAYVELNAQRLPMTTQTALFVAKLLSPVILEVIRSEVRDAKREWERREVQL